MGQPRSQTRASGGIPELNADLQLILHISQGDRDAFVKLYRLYQVKLGRFLINVVRNPQIAEEVLDDTMLVVWEHAADFKGESKVSTWIFAIAYRKAIRALKRFDAPIEDDDYHTRLSDRATPEEAFGAQRLNDLLRAAMEELSPDHRAVIELTYFSDLGYREIAIIMDCPVDTVKTRMFYARRRLKACLAGDFQDWI